MGARAEGNESEAEAALEMAHRLMEENNVTMMDLAESDREKELGKLINEVEAIKAFKGFEKSLSASMAKLFDCEIVYGSVGRKQEMHYLGREGNVRTAWAMYTWIRDKLWEDSKKECKKKYGKYQVSFCNSYCLGAANSIWNRVVEMKGKDAENSGEWGLVAVNEVRSFMKSEYPMLVRRNRSSRYGDSSGYASGKSAGNDIGLNKQFGLKAIC